MATNSNLSIDVPLIASVKHEPRSPPSSPPMPQPQLGTEAEAELKHKDEAGVDGDTQVLPIVHLPPQFFESINELSSLSTLIQTFKLRFDELKRHLDFIQNALDTNSNEVPRSPHQPLSQPEQQQIQNQNQNQHQHQHQHRLESVPSSKKPLETKATTQSKGKTEGEAETEATEPGTKESSKSEVQLLCETMCSRDLRKYIVTRLHNATKLREEVPAALKCAPNPAKLVLNCIGRFYLQGTKAYITDSPMIPARKAAILTMEYFLLMMDNQAEIKAEVKKEAETGAVLWRNRLISEGGLSRAAEIDARGLLLFVACYGIPAVFKNEDVWNLIQLSDLRMIADALRRSPALVERVSVIIEGMMKNGMTFEAVEVTSLFGIDDKFPLQKILNSFLHESKELYKRNRQDARGSPHLLKYANEKQLDALKSVMKCLEGHKIDPVEILPGWQIKEKMSNLEKETADLNKKVQERVNAKRKADMNDSLSKKSQETKRSLGLTARGSPMISPLVGGLHELRAASHLDSQSSYDALLPRSSFDCELPCRVNSYPSSSSIPYGYGAVPLPESVHSGGLHADGVRSGISSRYCLLSSGLYSDTNSHGVIDRAGQMMNNNGTSYGCHGVGETAFGGIHRSVGQSVAAHPAVFSRASEGFPGILYSPTPGTANQRLSSDLYSFADVVGEGELYNNSSHQSGPLQPFVPAQHRSYME